MRNRKLWIILGIASAAVIIIAGSAGYYLGRNNSGEMTAAGDVPEAESSPLASGMTREDVPPGITVPDRETQTADNVAAPEVVAQAAPGVDSKRRHFEIEVRDGAFAPDTVIVGQGDIARITFTALDRDYDLVQPDYGFKGSLPQGVERMLEGSFHAEGKFMFYCPSCGGPEQGPKGYIIVVPK